MGARRYLIGGCFPFRLIYTHETNGSLRIISMLNGGKGTFIVITLWARNKDKEKLLSFFDQSPFCTFDRGWNK